MTNAQADCSTCESAKPELMPENKLAFKLWMLVKRQWRVGANGPVGLDWPAIFSVAKLWQIKVTPEIFQKFSALENHVISKAVELNGQ